MYNKEIPFAKTHTNTTAHERSKGRSSKQRVSLLGEKQVSLHRYYYSDGRFRETALPEFLLEWFLPFSHD